MMLEPAPGLLGRPRKPQGRRALARVLRELGALRVEHAVDIVLDVGDALVAAHENGIVHGQIATHTVQVAYSFEHGAKDVQIFALTPEGDSGPAPAITPLIAPEQRDRERKIDTRVDIWALGALLVTMITGRPPAPGAAKVPEGAMPRSLANVVESCLSVDPERRPANVIALAESIASFASSPPDRFEALATRRAVAERAQQQKERLERRGLADMPNVLDKLDDLAITRARGTETATIRSVLDKPTNQRDLDRLMKVVRDNTEEARIEGASQLPSLLDEDEDEMNIPTTMLDEGYIPEASMASPLTTISEEVSRVTALPVGPVEPLVEVLAQEPTAQPVPTLVPPPPVQPQVETLPMVMPVAPSEAHRADAPSGGVSKFLIAALMVCLATTVIGFIVARAASFTPPAMGTIATAQASAAAAPAAPLVETASTSTSKPSSSAASTITTSTPTFSPSSLPDAVLTPDQLPSAKKKR